MLYYVTLNDRQFPLALLEPTRDGQHRAQGASGELAIEVLSRSVHGRPALVLVDGVVHRVLSSGGERPAAERRAVINGQSVSLRVESELERRARPNRHTPARSASQVLAPMPGRV